MPVTPPDIPGLIGWWKSDDITGVSNGGDVTLWPSNGTYGPDLDETAGTPPTLDTSVAINGIPGVRFAAGRTLRDTTAGTLTGFTNGLAGASLYAVARLESTPAASVRIVAIATGTSGVGESRFALSMNTSNQPTFAARRVDGVAASIVTSSSTAATNAPHIIAGTIDYGTTTQRLWLDGTLVGSSTSALTTGTTSTDSKGVGIGSHPGNAAEGIPGCAFEVIALDHAATASEHEQIHGYLWSRFSISVANYVAVYPASVAALAAVLAPSPSAGTGASVAPGVVAATAAVHAPTVNVGEPETPAGPANPLLRRARSQFSIDTTFRI